MKEPYKFEPHNPKGKIVGKDYCVKCGLLYLRNEFTQWAIKMGCNNEDHPQHAQIRKLAK